MKRTPRTAPPRRPGRPEAGSAPEARQRLLDAARRLFASEGFAAASSRRIAEEAGVNPALIHYYFENKQGLYEAMLEDTVGPLLQRLRGIVAAGGTPADIDDLIGAYMRTLAANPWLSRLLVREVLSEEGRFRERFIRLFATRGGGILRAALEAGRSRGEVRPDADPGLAALSLVSLMLFPFVALPVAAQVFDLQLEGAQLERLIEHTRSLFMHGIAARESQA